MSATTSSTPAAEALRPWHLLTAAETADILAVSAAVGLDEDQAHQHREVAGPNTLPAPNRRRRVMLLLDQLRNPLVLLLLAAAVIAGMVGDATDTAIILAVVVINSLLGFVQESRAENSLESLRQMLARAVSRAEQLEVDESALTVESIPTPKDRHPVSAVDAPLGDLRCWCS